MTRVATEKDAEGIGKVLAKSYSIKDDAEGKTVFLDETKKGILYIVAKKNKTIIGIVTLKFHGLPKHGLCELDRIAVLPEWKGKGIAEELFDALVQETKKWYGTKKATLRKLIILTHADNTRAQRFYEKMGCLHEATLKDHYYKGKDEFVYSRFFT